MALVCVLGGAWLTGTWWTCALTGPPYTDEAQLRVSLWTALVIPNDGELKISVSIDELCTQGQQESFCSRVKAIRVLVILSEISSLCSALCMLVGFFGAKCVREQALLASGAHMAGASFTFLLSSAIIGQSISSVQLFAELAVGHDRALKVRPNGYGFMCVLVGLSVILPAALNAALVRCRRKSRAAVGVSSKSCSRCGSKARGMSSEGMASAGSTSAAAVV